MQSFGGSAEVKFLSEDEECADVLCVHIGVSIVNAAAQ